MSKRGSIGRLKIHNAKNHGRKAKGDPGAAPDTSKTRELGQAWADAIAGGKK